MLNESAFSAGRKVMWADQGVTVKEALNSADAIKAAGLDWLVTGNPIFDQLGNQIPNYFANTRDKDGKVLGVVKGRYKIVQNEDAFAFTDSLIGEGVRYETAGAFDGGKKIWLLAKMPKDYKILGDTVEPYLVFSNSFDGSGSIKVATTGVRVVCQNTLNMALNGAKRKWSAKHSGSIEYKLAEARETLQIADAYFQRLDTKMQELYKIKLTDDKVKDIVKMIVPVDDGMTDRKKRNLIDMQNDIMYRYFTMPDLVVMDNTAARLVHAVSDTSTHKAPARNTKNYAENLFAKQIEGNDLLDRAVEVVTGIR